MGGMCSLSSVCQIPVYSNPFLSKLSQLLSNLASSPLQYSLTKHGMP